MTLLHITKNKIKMCGICGIQTWGSTTIDKELIVRMNTTLTHRGPDEEGIYLNSGVALGHRRLSIIDLKSGQQPMYNEDQTLVIVFNGEIYNYQEIRTQLIARGHIFKSNSDTETIIHAYEEYGRDCVSKLRGMFAFAIYNSTDKSLFLARDRLGKKPLYYYFDGNTFAFASEIKAILQIPNVKRDINLEAFSDYLSYLYIPAPKSIFKNISKLPAGHTLLLKNGVFDIREYWDVTFCDSGNSQQIASEQLQGLLSEAVNLRLISEVPLGAFLSGGIDSSLVVALMSSQSNKRIKTNCIGFNNNKFNETAYARETSVLFATEHHEQIVDIDCCSVLDKLAWYFDEPFADSSSLPTYYVSKMARENVTVALSGDGGDENFAGYRRYYFDALENRIRNYIPAFLRKTVIKTMGALYPKADWLPQKLRAKTLLTNVSKDPDEAYFLTMSHFLPSMKNRVIHPDILNSLKGYDSFDLFRNHYNKAQTDDLLSKIQYVDIKTYLTDDILVKVDRASMANSLEVRCPLLDHKIIEFAASLNSSLKLNGASGKYLLKKVAGQVLPSHVLTRKKMGFSIPVDEWFRGQLKEVVNNSIFSKDSFSQQYFSMPALKSMWNNHQAGTSNFGYQFWAIVMFEKWAGNYLS